MAAEEVDPRRRLSEEYKGIVSRIILLSFPLNNEEEDDEKDVDDAVSLELDRHFECIQQNLDACKAQTSTFDATVWHRHTTQMHPGVGIVPSLRNNFFTSSSWFCTRAFAKFYEILSRFEQLLMVRKASVFRTLHLCEAPGAFIAALDCFLRRTKRNDWQWTWKANSLNPHFEWADCDSMLLDDRLINVTMDNWLWGPLGDGNIFNFTRDYVDNSVKPNGRDFDLITADGSVNCTDDPGAQERNTFQLHFAELAIAFSCLSIGGSLVLKRFTMFTEDSHRLIAFLMANFDQCNVVKPVASKTSNSEVYFICGGFRGISPNISEKMFNAMAMGNWNTVLPACSNRIRRNILTIAGQLADIQSRLIRFNVESFSLKASNNQDRFMTEIIGWQKCVQANYVRMCRLNDTVDFNCEDMLMFKKMPVAPWHQNLYAPNFLLLDVDGRNQMTENLRVENLLSSTGFSALFSVTISNPFRMDEIVFDDAFNKTNDLQLIRNGRSSAPTNSLFCDRSLLILLRHSGKDYADLCFSKPMKMRGQSGRMSPVDWLHLICQISIERPCHFRWQLERNMPNLLSSRFSCKILLFLVLLYETVTIGCEEKLDGNGNTKYRFFMDCDVLKKHGSLPSSLNNFVATLATFLAVPAELMPNFLDVFPLNLMTEPGFYNPLRAFNDHFIKMLLISDQISTQLSDASECNDDISDPF